MRQEEVETSSPKAITETAEVVVLVGTHTPTLTLHPTLTPTITLTQTPVLEPVYIQPYCSMFKESPVTVRAHQPVILKWDWDAVTEQYVRDHIEAALYEIRLDGRLIHAGYTSPAIEQVYNERLGSTVWRYSWYAEVGALTLGTHRAERYLAWKWKIFDGWDYYGPGSSIETEWDYCDILVTEGP
jgi:hypothetical protein